MTIAELKRRLSVGTEWTGIFLRGPHAGVPYRRCVLKQSDEMVSIILDGPLKDREVGMRWRGVKVRQEGESIVLNDGAKDFLLIVDSPAG
jgi:hypothetical protein